MPNVHRDGDIPLGYAAADAFAPPGHRRQHGHHDDQQQQQQERVRGRNRLKKRISQRNSGTQHVPDQNGYESDQSPSRAPQQENIPPGAPPMYPGQQGQQPGMVQVSLVLFLSFKFFVEFVGYLNHRLKIPTNHLQQFFGKKEKLSIHLDTYRSKAILSEISEIVCLIM